MPAITAAILAAFAGYAGAWYFGAVDGNFALLLFLATVVTGIYWVAERAYFLPRRRQAADAASQIDALRAEDAVVQQALADINANVTAQQAEGYKPGLRGFELAFDRMDVPRERVLHVAQSLFHDHVPAKREGLPSVWINRRHDSPGWGATPEPTEQWTYNLEFTSMAAFADAADQAFGDAPTTNA